MGFQVASQVRKWKVSLYVETFAINGNEMYVISGNVVSEFLLSGCLAACLHLFIAKLGQLQMSAITNVIKGLRQVAETIAES